MIAVFRILVKSQLTFDRAAAITATNG